MLGLKILLQRRINYRRIMGDMLFRELTKVVQLYYDINLLKERNMKQCAMCKTPIDKDEHLCPECWKKEKMDQEFVGYWGGVSSGWRINAPGLPAMHPLPTHWMPLPEMPKKEGENRWKKQSL